MIKNKNLTILGIETSCDETAAAILEIKNNKINILSNVVSSQIKVHQKYGGVVPELAAREHLKNIVPVFEKALGVLNPKSKALNPCLPAGRLNKSKIQNLKQIKNHKSEIINFIDAIAVTTGPGLITSLLIGVEAAKTLAFAWKKPIIPINHLEGHIYANWLNSPPVRLASRSKRARGGVRGGGSNFPILCLIISGGHTELVLMKNYGQYEKIGQTLDDAVGECYDKVAKLLQIGYPGGPIIEKLAQKGNPASYLLPRPLLNQKNFNFSFSGLKTAVLYLARDRFIKSSVLKISKQELADLCASFQQAIFDVLTEKTLNAALKYNVKNVLLAGGVAANYSLREYFANKIKEKKLVINFSYPELKFCTDNAAMIAMAGYFHVLHKNFTTWQKIKPDPNLEIA